MRMFLTIVERPGLLDRPILTRATNGLAIVLRMDF